MWAIVAQKTHTKIQAYPSFTSLKPSENETFLDIQSANQSIVLSIQTARAIYYLLSDVWVSENADCKDCFSFQTF